MYLCQFTQFVSCISTSHLAFYALGNICRGFGTHQSAESTAKKEWMKVASSAAVPLTSQISGMFFFPSAVIQLEFLDILKRNYAWMVF